MPRNVHALLMSVAKPTDYLRGTDLPKIPGIDDAVGRFKKVLVDRFTQLTVTHLPGAEATHDAALKDLRQSFATTDLVIILFAGHGRTSKDGYQSWLLHDQELTDAELADEIARISKTAEVFLVSDCCYGGGIRRRGPQSADDPILKKISDFILHLLGRDSMIKLEDIQLQGLARGWHPSQLLNRVSPTMRTAAVNDIVCIAGAAWNDTVSSSAEVALIERMITSLANDDSHGTLADVFDEQANTGRNFQLFIRPNDHMHLPMLARDRLPSLKDTAMENTYIVLINYSDTTQTVSFKLAQNQRVDLEEIRPPGTNDSAYQAQGDVNHPTGLLLKPGAIVGFIVASNVSFTLPTTGICIQMRGKNPPMPPPPKPQVFKDMPDQDFEDLYAGTYAVGGLDDIGDQGNDDEGESTTPRTAAS